ncbi:hypothetical protein [Vogesella indigofera]|uniref:Uncharacterized protein n=1 Tax=Vogesella indigofera TaxID=45465 RepID=A0ABT5I3B4_VOGIN|nr:hypothetical protein [Vogesella indigofera]MDC7690660.1 hypothetical protein [Vogesella indigofera]
MRAQQNAEILLNRRQSIAIQLDIQKAADAHLATGKRLKAQVDNLRAYALETKQMEQAIRGGFKFLGFHVGGTPTYDQFAIARRKQVFNQAKEQINEKLADWRQTWAQLKAEYLSPEQKAAYQELAQRYGVTEYERGPDADKKSESSRHVEPTSPSPACEPSPPDGAPNGPT